VELAVELFDSLSKRRRALVVHVIKCLHLDATEKCSVPPLQILTPADAIMAVVFSPRDRCRLLRKRGIYRMARRGVCIQSAAKKSGTRKAFTSPGFAQSNSADLADRHSTNFGAQNTNCVSFQSCPPNRSPSVKKDNTTDKSSRVHPMILQGRSPTASRTLSQTLHAV
jgi:hypothetical protein